MVKVFLVNYRSFVQGCKYACPPYFCCKFGHFMQRLCKDDIQFHQHCNGKNSRLESSRWVITESTSNFITMTLYYKKCDSISYDCLHHLEQSLKARLSTQCFSYAFNGRVGCHSNAICDTDNKQRQKMTQNDWQHIKWLPSEVVFVSKLQELEKQWVENISCILVCNWLLVPSCWSVPWPLWRCWMLLHWTCSNKCLW